MHTHGRPSTSVISLALSCVISFKLGMGSAVKVLVPHAFELQVLFVAEQNSLVPIFRLEREFELFSAHEADQIGRNAPSEPIHVTPGILPGFDHSQSHLW